MKQIPIHLSMNGVVTSLTTGFKPYRILMPFREAYPWRYLRISPRSLLFQPLSRDIAEMLSVTRRISPLTPSYYIEHYHCYMAY